jgi:ubiquinone biosynthesis protein
MSVLGLLTRKGRLRFRRYRNIFSTLISYGFGEVVYQTGLGKALRLFRRVFRPGGGDQYDEALLGEAPTWIRLRMAVEQLGPTFIKLGQILSNRPDLIPRGLQRELAKLQENVPPFPTAQAIGVIEEELHESMETLFREFDDTPFAAASIAQLHRAVLTEGDEVAVKVQRPGLQELVQVDIEILKELAELLERYVPESRSVGPRDVVAEFQRGILQELDFRRETAAIERFAAQFAEEDDIKVPKVYRNYGTKRVLTMEFVQGRPLGQLLEHGIEDREDGARIAKLGAELTLKQIFTHGFFHADPHPGNILLLDDGRLCYLDFGLTGNLVQRELEVVSDILISIMQRNEQNAARAVVRLAGSRDFETARNIEREIAELIERFRSAQAGDFSFTALLAELVAVLVDEGLSLPADLYLLVKSLITIEGIATRLDPDFDFASQLEPFAETLVRERYDPKRLTSRAFTMAEDYAELLQNLPGDYYKLVDMVSSGRIQFSLDDGTTRPLRRALLQASSALVSAIVLAALIIGSAVIVHSGVPPLWHGVPIIGIVGFVAAGLLGFGLLIRMIRTPK